MNSPETVAIDPATRGNGPARRQGNGAPSAGSRRITFIKWLRKVHSWVGLCGAALGLLMGTSGFLLNHRGQPLRVSTGEPQVESLQVQLPQPAAEARRDLAKWLKQELKVPGKPGRMQKEPSHPVAWGERKAIQPERWQIIFATPNENTSAEYWVGNDYVTVKRSANTFLATLTNLHKGVGLSVGWVLLIDTLAGGVILLSLTGVLLWTQLNKRRTIGAVLVLGSIVAAIVAGMV